MARISSPQNGFVSIFTVLFFIVFITVITVGFLRIIVQEQGQSTDNSLTASALAAARAGIEDGKRALLLYAQTDSSDPAHQALDAAFASQSCDGIFGNPTLQNALALKADGTIASSSNLQQAYSCLTINPFTPDYSGQALLNKSQFIPLATQAPFATLKFGWHGTAADKEGPLSATTTIASPSLPTVANWTSAHLPAFIRLQLISVPSGSFTQTDIHSQTIFLTAGRFTNQANTAAFTDDQPTGRPNTALSVVGCTIGTGVDYACSVNLSSSFFAAANTHLYLRATPLYTSTHFKMNALDASGQPVNFALAEPTIDATGRTSNVFRRIQARVQLDASSILPEYALETGGDICKAFYVTDNTIQDTATCPLK